MDGVKKLTRVDEPDNLLSDFCESYAGRCRGILIPYAAEVVLIVAMSSLALAAEYFSKKFGRKMSVKPVRDVLAKVQQGIIPVSRNEIQAVAKLHPFARRFLEKAPWAADAKMVAKVVHPHEAGTNGNMPKKKPGRPKKAAKPTVHPLSGNQWKQTRKSQFPPEELERRRKLMAQIDEEVPD